jgi:tRNA G10  N-methylase Trm11
LYIGFVEEAHRVLKRNGRLALVTPYFITRSGQAVTMPIEEKLVNCGFKAVQPFSKEMFSDNTTGVEELVNMRSLIEVDEHHKVGREIHIYEK